MNVTLQRYCSNYLCSFLRAIRPCGLTRRWASLWRVAELAIRARDKHKQPCTAMGLYRGLEPTVFIYIVAVVLVT